MNNVLYTEICYICGKKCLDHEELVNLPAKKDGITVHKKCKDMYGKDIIQNKKELDGRHNKTYKKVTEKAS